MAAGTLSEELDIADGSLTNHFRTDKSERRRDLAIRGRAPME